MTSIAEILSYVEGRLDDQSQIAWFHSLARRYQAGKEVFQYGGATVSTVWITLLNRIITEVYKASLAHSRPVRLFQGTSVTSIVRPVRLEIPLSLRCLDDLASDMAVNYIRQQKDIRASVESVSLDNSNDWYQGGYFFGVAVSSKLVAQCLELVVPRDDVIVDIHGTTVDPHNLFDHGREIREQYLEEIKKRVPFFRDRYWLDDEILSSLALADVTTPKAARFANKVILAPAHCNEIASYLSQQMRKKVLNGSGGDIAPKSISVVIFDTDSPMSYQAVNNYHMDVGAPTLPGLTLLGISGSADALEWLHAYRMALISQFHMPGIFCSNVTKEYVPYVFFGVIHPRNYYLLVNPEKLDLLRYRGNVCPRIEFFYTLSDFAEASERDDGMLEHDISRFSVGERNEC